MMRGRRNPPTSAFHSTKSTPRNLQSNKSASFRWGILIMESLILIILVIIPGVWSGNSGVTSQCALKGTSIVLKCEFDYPVFEIVTSVNWFKDLSKCDKLRKVPQSSLPSNPEHFKHVGNRKWDCSLEINDVQPADGGKYIFSFETTHAKLKRWRNQTVAQLSVKELTTVVQPSTVTEGDNVTLTCVSGCATPTDIVWFRDGQPVPNPVFQARREDAGSYYCAVRGQETIRSASVALNVQYALNKVTLSMSPSGDVVKGGSVTFTCSTDANPPVTPNGHSLYKDGQFIGSGQNHTISDIQPSHSGLYYCQASNNISWRGIDLIISTEVHLNVQYRPVNISISMDPPHVVEGCSVNLTCSSVAHPAADNYTWYKRVASSSSLLQVGSGQVLSIPAMEISHTGFYFCRAKNRLGENNSTELHMKENGDQALPILAGIGVSLLVTIFVLSLLLYWRKQRNDEEKKTLFDFRLSGENSASEDKSNSVFVKIHSFPCSAPPVPDVTPHSQRNSQHEHDACMSCEDDITSAVSMKSRIPSLPHPINNSRALQDSWSKAGENDDSMSYTTVSKAT